MCGQSVVLTVSRAAALSRDWGSRISRLLFAAAFLAAATALHAQQLTFSADRVGRIDRAMQSYVDSGFIAGAATLVMQHGRVVYQGAYGWADRERGRKMSGDAIFRIASQSKAVTAVAVMMLVEEGRIALGEPVSRYMPTFARTAVVARSDSARSLVPAKRLISIRDLLTHTAGISYGTDPQVAALYEAKGLGPAAGFGWYLADKAEPICVTMDRLGSLPFVAQPGEAFVYGYSTDILGCVVERVSGMPLDQFFRQRVFDPLGMPDTYFYLPEDKRSRLAAVYAPDESGKLSRAVLGSRGQGHYVEGPRASFAGGAGLLSTTHDYARFLQMLLNGGELDGVRLLSPTTVGLMTANQVGTLYSPDGYGFGLGFRTTERLGGGGLPFSIGSYGWGGAYQSTYWVDPAQGLVALFMSQHLPNVQPNVANRFVWLVYQAMVPGPAPTTNPA
ncbi:MAG: beta-lactamase family protein [Gemmatimonadetes bacterium]|nr:beta-lactamase family protein [Gemmatimonadota bacterium]